MAPQGRVFSARFNSWQETVTQLLNAAELKKQLQETTTLLIKPNLVKALPPPITTPVGLIDALITSLKKMTDARIIIGEGCGAMEYETQHVFDELGYTKMAGKHQVELMDLNFEELVRLRNPACRRWPEMYLPKIAMENFLISVPVLKAHTLTGVTLTMKNMMGLVPPKHYRKGQRWKKAAFHDRVQEGVADLNRYRTPDFTLLDATSGMAQAHLWGPTCDPPVGILVAGYDPVAIDAYGTELLKRRWRDIGHIRTVHGELGQAEPLHIVDV